LRGRQREDLFVITLKLAVKGRGGGLGILLDGSGDLNRPDTVPPTASSIQLGTTKLEPRTAHLKSGSRRGKKEKLFGSALGIKGLSSPAGQGAPRKLACHALSKESVRSWTKTAAVPGQGDGGGLMEDFGFILKGHRSLGLGGEIRTRGVDRKGEGASQKKGGKCGRASGDGRTREVYKLSKEHEKWSSMASNGEYRSFSSPIRPQTLWGKHRSGRERR